MEEEKDSRSRDSDSETILDSIYSENKYEELSEDEPALIKTTKRQFAIKSTAPREFDNNIELSEIDSDISGEGSSEEEYEGTEYDEDDDKSEIEQDSEGDVSEIDELDEIPVIPNVIYDNQKMKPSDAQIFEILSKANRGEISGDKIAQHEQYLLKDGDIVLTFVKDKNDYTHKIDLYQWFNNSGPIRPKVGPNKLKVTYFYIIHEDGTYSRDFTKTTYSIASQLNTSNYPVLTYYSGDSSMFKARKHGRSTKKNIPHRRTNKQTMDKIKKDVRTERSPKTIYSSLKSDKSSEFGEKVYDKIQLTAGPKNPKQIYNAKYRMKMKYRLKPDEMYSVHELINQLDGFIYRKINQNNGFIIICGNSDLIRASKQILKLSYSEERSSIKQMFTYDTTFDQSEKRKKFRPLYVSSLVMKNILLSEEPCFPVIFGIHSSKSQWIHDQFWLAAEEILNISALTMIPVVVDREPAIRNAIIKFVGRNPLICQKHIQNNIHDFFKNKTINGRSFDLQSIKDKVDRLFAFKVDDSKIDEYEYLFDEYVKELWPETGKNEHPHQVFLDYFNSHLRHDILYYSTAQIAKKYAIFQDGLSVTNNMSESINKTLKESGFINWNYDPVDALVLGLFLHQCEIVDEFELATRSAGEYEHKRNSPFKIRVIPRNRKYKHVEKDNLLEFIKSGIEAPNENIQKLDGYRNTAIAIAKICIEHDGIHLNAKQKKLIVTNPFNGIDFTVTPKLGEPLSCSCNASALCFHRLAVLMGGYGYIPDEDDFKYDLSLIELKPKKPKIKRKIRAKDIIIDIEKSETSFNQDDSDFDSTQNSHWSKLLRNKKTSTPIKPDPESKKQLKLTIVNSPNISPPEYSPDISPKASPLKKLLSKSKWVEGTDFKTAILTTEQISAYSDKIKELLRDKRDYFFGKSSSQKYSYPRESFGFDVTKESIQLFNDGKFVSLRPETEIDAQIIDDFIEELIRMGKKKKKNIQDEILYLNTSFQRLYSDFDDLNKMKELLPTLYHAKPLNHDIILTTLSRALSHWMLGSIFFRDKKIIIFDSLKVKEPKEIRPYFHQLLKLCQVSYLIAGMPFELSDWQFIYSTDCPSQNNTYDCGLFTVHIVYSIVRSEEYLRLNSLMSRLWIASVLNSCYLAHGYPIKPFYERKKLSHRANLNSKQIKEEEDAAISNSIRCYKIMNQLTPKYTLNRLGAVEFIRNWAELNSSDLNLTICGHQECVKPSEINPSISLCVMCRKWHHHACIKNADSTMDIESLCYYVCNLCNNKFV